MSTMWHKKIGIMGGTFDPVHYGHLLIAQAAAEEFGLDRVIFLPTGKSPHKSAACVTEPDLRCAMVQLAIRDNPRFVMSDLEAKNKEINYTYATLQKMRRIYKDARLYFIMGEDSLDDFKDWRRPEEICRLAAVLVAVRDGSQTGVADKLIQAKERYAADMHLLHAPVFSVSSHDIRRRIRDGKDVRYMIQKDVEAFIKKHALYTEQE